ncbi:MAG: Fic family protein [Desulfuromonadaceae bacterium]
MGGKFYACLDRDIKEILLKQIRNLWTHTSTAIEGNSLTLGDTEFILEEGLTVAGKPIRDHQDVIGHAKAIEVVYQLVEKDSIAEEDIFALHRVMLIDPVLDVYRPVGAWKAEDNFTNYIDPQGKQKWRQYPATSKTPALMAEWLQKLNQALQQPLSRDAALGAYADLHLDFVTIHPFFDGNGRMARLLCNLPVLKAGFPPIVVPEADRQRYKKTISDYQSNISDLERIQSLQCFPCNAGRKAFIELCRGYWSETMELLDNAHAIQSRRRGGPGSETE